LFYIYKDNNRQPKPIGTAQRWHTQNTNQQRRFSLGSEVQASFI